MKIMKGTHPTTPPKGPPNRAAPIKTPDLADMAHFHKLAASGALSDMMFNLGGGKRK